MPDTTIYEFGDVVLVYYYHTDSTIKEKRPAVVVSDTVHNRDDIDIVLMQVSTKGKHLVRHGSLEIAEWNEIGLFGPSIIKPVLFTYPKEDVLRTFGRLKPASRTTLRKTVASIFGFRVASNEPGRPSGQSQPFPRR